MRNQELASNKEEGRLNRDGKMRVTYFRETFDAETVNIGFCFRGWEGGGVVDEEECCEEEGYGYMGIKHGYHSQRQPLAC